MLNSNFLMRIAECATRKQSASSFCNTSKLSITQILSITGSYQDFVTNVKVYCAFFIIT